MALHEKPHKRPVQRHNARGNAAIIAAERSHFLD
jgi:hypothetical protein